MVKVYSSTVVTNFQPCQNVWYTLLSYYVSKLGFFYVKSPHQP